jgi:hypothetical protein
MKHGPEFDEIRKESEARQRAILWEDGVRNGKSVDEFLWKGDPNAKPVQRAGLIVFATFFGLFGVLAIVASIWSQTKDEWIGRFLGTLIGIGLTLVAIRLFLNAFRRSKKQPVDNTEDEE